MHMSLFMGTSSTYPFIDFDWFIVIGGSRFSRSHQIIPPQEAMENFVFPDKCSFMLIAMTIYLPTPVDFKTLPVDLPNFLAL